MSRRVSSLYRERGGSIGMSGKAAISSRHIGYRRARAHQARARRKPASEAGIDTPIGGDGSRAGHRVKATPVASPSQGQGLCGPLG